MRGLNPDTLWLDEVDLSRTLAVHGEEWHIVDAGGKPWSDPESDPMQDIKDAQRLYAQQAGGGGYWGTTHHGGGHGGTAWAKSYHGKNDLPEEQELFVVDGWTPDQELPAHVNHPLITSLGVDDWIKIQAARADWKRWCEIKDDVLYTVYKKHTRVISAGYQTDDDTYPPDINGSREEVIASYFDTVNKIITEFLSYFAYGELGQRIIHGRQNFTDRTWDRFDNVMNQSVWRFLRRINDNTIDQIGRRKLSDNRSYHAQDDSVYGIVSASFPNNNVGAGRALQGFFPATMEKHIDVSGVMNAITVFGDQVKKAAGSMDMLMSTQ